MWVVSLDAGLRGAYGNGICCLAWEGICFSSSEQLTSDCDLFLNHSLGTKTSSAADAKRVGWLFCPFEKCTSFRYAVDSADIFASHNTQREASFRVCLHASHFLASSVGMLIEIELALHKRSSENSLLVFSGRRDGEIVVKTLS